MKNSIGMFDFVKGFAVCTIVIGHLCMQFNVVENITLNTYNLIVLRILYLCLGYGTMAMFILISGYGFRKKKVWSCIKQQANYILKPYIIVTIAIAVIFPIVHYAFFKWKAAAIKEMIREVLAFLLVISGESGIVIGEYALYSCGAIWFMIALMNSWIILNLIMQIENQKIQKILVLLITVIGWFLSRYGIWPFCFQQSLIFTGYLYAGYWIKKNKLLEKKFSIWEKILMGICAIIGGAIGQVEMANNVYALGIFDVIFSGVVGFLMLKVALKINQFSCGIISIVKKIGRYSLWIICLHTVESICFPWYLLADRSKINPLLGFCIAIIGKIIIILLGYILIDKTKSVLKKISVKKGIELS